MSYRTPEFLQKLASLGTAIVPDMIIGTAALYAPLHSRAPAPDVKVSLDLQYGDDERQRLDVYSPAAATQQRPVLLFVHGGGFVAGDKRQPNSPFYENVGRWAVRNGLIGVAMTYRLAPEHRWPSGSDDLASAVRFVRQCIGEFGGDASRIYLMGQSAGAVHVGSYLAREQSPSKDGWQPAGAILVSGMYDTATMERNLPYDAYFGGNPAVDAERPFLEALARTRVPLMSVIGELEPVDFLRQFNLLNSAYLQQHQRLPRIVQMAGHNHLSTVMHLNTDDQTLAHPLLEFIRNTP